MKLNELIASIEAPSKAKAREIVANAIGLREISIRSMANGNRKITPEIAVAIEKAFPGKITRAELRPDIFN